MGESSESGISQSQKRQTGNTGDELEDTKRQRISTDEVSNEQIDKLLEDPALNDIMNKEGSITSSGGSSSVGNSGGSGAGHVDMGGLDLDLESILGNTQVKTEGYSKASTPDIQPTGMVGNAVGSESLGDIGTRPNPNMHIARGNEFKPDMGLASGGLNLNRSGTLLQNPQGIQGLNSFNDSRFKTASAQAVNKDKAKGIDTSQLNDALAVAGVDVQHEEEILMQQQMSRRYAPARDQNSYLRMARSPSFLNQYHLSSFIHSVARENGVFQNFLHDSEMLELMSVACESWIANIITKTIILSRHRRRAVASFNNKGKKHNSSQRSEVSKELKAIASRQKELEEKRVNKRIALGLEQTGVDPANTNESSKAGAEETLHRAANATAAMMTRNPGGKKYSWMTANSSATDDSRSSTDKSGPGKQSTIISSRGDNGLRFREIRTGNSVTMKDLLGAIEEERIGTEKAVLKGYAKLKD